MAKSIRRDAVKKVARGSVVEDAAGRFGLRRLSSRKVEASQCQRRYAEARCETAMEVGCNIEPDSASFWLDALGDRDGEPGSYLRPSRGEC
jgi:hypothetical protein